MQQIHTNLAPVRYKKVIFKGFLFHLLYYQANYINWRIWFEQQLALTKISFWSTVSDLLKQGQTFLAIFYCNLGIFEFLSIPLNMIDDLLESTVHQEANIVIYRSTLPVYWSLVSVFSVHLYQYSVELNFGKTWIKKKQTFIVQKKVTF